MKTAIQKMNRTDVWIEELDLKAKGLIVRLVVGAELSPEEAKGMQVAARSSLGKAIPVTFLNSVTVNPGNVTYVDWIGKSDAKSTISSIDVKWKTESRSFHIPQTQSGR